MGLLIDIVNTLRKRETIDGYKYAVGDVIELKQEINNSLFAEIVFIDTQRNNPYQICQEYSGCDDVVYSWVAEGEIKGIV